MHWTWKQPDKLLTSILSRPKLWWIHWIKQTEKIITFDISAVKSIFMKYLNVWASNTHHTSSTAQYHASKYLQNQIFHQTQWMTLTCAQFWVTYWPLMTLSDPNQSTSRFTIQKHWISLPKIECEAKTLWRMTKHLLWLRIFHQNDTSY